MPLDFARVYPGQYDLTDGLDAVNFQEMVKDFMDEVRTNPDTFLNRREEVVQFCAAIADDNTWSLAVKMAPELSRDQAYDTSETSVLNFILETVKNKRPRAPTTDRRNIQEKLMLRRKTYQTIEHLFMLGGRDGTAEGRERLRILTDAAITILDPANG